MMSKPKILFYDIETTPLQAWIWRPGKQVVRPAQLVEGYTRNDIICISYEWLHTNEKGTLHWGYEKQNSKQMVKDFTKICHEADLIIGKNNKRFDDKHLNSARLWHGLAGAPDLLSKVDDLETQMRRHFALASYGLDYFSEELGFGGKTKMCFDDWINIVYTKGKASYNKMLKYCAKDVHDTKLIWKHCEKHFQPKFNYSTFSGNMVCKVCGSKNIRKNGTRTSTSGMVSQNYFCTDHNGYAGKLNLNARKPVLRS